MANDKVTFLPGNGRGDLVGLPVSSFTDTPNGSGGTVTFEVTTTTRQEIKEARDLGKSGTVVLTDPNTGENVTFVGATLTGYDVSANGTGAITFSYTGEVPCYCRGTLILTPGGEVAVEQLKAGDLVTTFAGESKPIRWVGRRSYAGRFVAGSRDVLPVCIKAGALADGVPRRDLWVSPRHAMFLDGALIPAANLVNGVSVVQAETVESVHYIHVELAEHDVIWAEGAASETFVDDDSRAMFHNIDEYRTNYPDAVAVPALYCAPRLEDGYALQAIQQRIAERAGLTQPALTLGAMRGGLDRVTRTELQGWAQDPLHPEVPVCLDVLVDGVQVAQTLANRFRADLQTAGVGSGRHGFDVRLSVPLDGVGVLEIRRSADAALLSRVDLKIATLAEAA